MSFYSIDLFSGVGGLTHGMVKAGFKVITAIEIDKDAAKAYKMNFPDINVIEEDIKKIDIKDHYCPVVKIFKCCNCINNNMLYR